MTLATAPDSSRRNAIRLLDGGIGTEIQRRGIALHPCYWSALAHLKHPQTILGIYQDYIDAGASIISANTFMAGRHILAAGGVNDFELVNRRAVEIALRARDRHAERDVLVAGCLSVIPPLDRAQSLPRGSAIEANYRDQARLLADAGVDLLLAEMLLDSRSAASLLAACDATGLPVWAGVSASAGPGDGNLMAFRPVGELQMLAPEPLAALLETVCACNPNAVGIMHTALALMPAALDQLTARWPGRRFAYAQTGSFGGRDWRFDRAAGPAAYASAALGWIDTYAISAVGGCCGTGPEHIRAIDRLLNGGA